MKRVMLKSLVALAAACAFGGAFAQERVLKMGLASPENHPAAAGMKKFAETVAAKTNGRIKIQNFYAGALGAERESIESVQLGTQELTTTSTGPIR